MPKVRHKSMPLTVACQIRQLSLSILCPSHFGSTPKPPIWFLDVAEFCPITALTCLGLCADPFSHSQLDRQLSFCLFEHLPSSSPLASSAEAVTHLTPGFHFRLQLLFLFGLHCCDKTLTRNSVGEEGVHLSYILQSIIGGSQSRDQEIETKLTMAEGSLVACLIWLPRLPFIHSPGPPAQGWHHPQTAGPSSIN